MQSLKINEMNETSMSQKTSKKEITTLEYYGKSIFEINSFDLKRDGPEWFNNIETDLKTVNYNSSQDIIFDICDKYYYLIFTAYIFDEMEGQLLFDYCHQYYWYNRLNRNTILFILQNSECCDYFSLLLEIFLKFIQMIKS
jgi:hypothetical protein